LTSGDKNFRPINMRWGPDGSIYLIDWHDQNPCHQAAPDSWDMTHGRIYKIQRKGAKSEPAPDLAKKSTKELVELLKNNNPWTYRTALRLLGERRDRDAAGPLEDLMVKTSDDRQSLRGLWGLHAIGAFDDAVAEKALQNTSPWVRSWAIRLLGEPGKVSDGILKQFADLAKKDSAPQVRLQLASTAQRLRTQDTLPILHSLMSHKDDAKDPCLPLMIWLAYEPRVSAQRNPALEWLKENAVGNPLVMNEIVPRSLRRLVATGKLEDLAASVAFLGEVKDSAVRRKGLEAMVAAFQGRQLDPPPQWKSVLAALSEDKDPEVSRLAGRLAVNFRDVEALRRALATAQDLSKPMRERIDAVHDLGLAYPPDALEPLQRLLKQEKSVDLQCEVCRALCAYDRPEIAKAVLSGWKDFTPTVRTEAVNLLSGRKDWAADLLAAVGKNEVPRTDLNDPAHSRSEGRQAQQANRRRLGQGARHARGTERPNRQDARRPGRKPVVIRARR
jgi:hypothetical protein